jgi:hypothetical protein
MKSIVAAIIGAAIGAGGIIVYQIIMNPSLTLKPSSLSQGGSFQGTIKNFAPTEPIYGVVYDTNGNPSGVFQAGVADASGNFSLSSQANMPVGVYNLVAFQTDKKKVASAIITVV